MAFWILFDGSNVEKAWYDVALPDNTIVENCWPNNGKMMATDGSGREWGAWCCEIRKRTHQRKPFSNVEVTGKPRAVLPERDSLPGLVRLTAMLERMAPKRGDL